MAQRKGDVEFIVAGEDHFSQILRSIMSDVQNMKQQVNQAGRQMDDSMRQAADSTRRSGEAVKTMADRLREIGQGVQHVKQLKSELDRVEDSARNAGQEMERGFRDGERAADRMAKQAAAVKQRLAEVAREARGMVDAINSSTAGLQGFVGDQIRRGVYVGGLAVTGFAAHSVMKTVDKEYEFAKLGSVLKSSYYKDGKLDEAAFKRDFADLQAFIQQQGLRKDRETDTMGMIGMATELAKNNMNPAQVKAALPVVADFAQATGLEPDVAAKYLANKLEAAKMDYTTENFSKIADQFVKTVDMSSLDPRDLLFAERYTDFGNAIGGVDYAISQAMQVLLSKVSVEGETAGTALRTLFIESSKLGISDSARSNVSSEKVGRVIDALIKEVNAVNKAVDADKSVAADQKGNEKILRKAAIMNRYMSQLTNDEQIEVGSLLFGKEAASVTTIFANDGYKNLLETISAIRNSTGITKRYADDRANTSKGDLVALGKAVDELQGKVGKSLQPLLDATTRQLMDLASEGKFSFEEISKGAEESAELLAKELNPEIAEVFEQLTKLATNGFQIGVALSPLAEGTFKSIVKLLNGDVSGAAHEIVLAIDATDLKIENLPGELQGLANAAKNAAIFLAAIAAVDKGIKVAENGKKIWDAGRRLGETISGKKNGGQLSEMDDAKIIKASVVNVYGDTVNSGKGGAPGSPTASPTPGNGKGAPGIPETAGRTAGMSTWAELAVTVGGVLAALGLSTSVSTVVADATADITGIKKEERLNDYAGASFWFDAAHHGAYYGNSPGDSARYREEMRTVGNMIMGYRDRVSLETLNRISKELWAEAEKNMKENRHHIFGDDVEDVAAYVDRRINRVRNTPDIEDARMEKTLRRQLAPEWEEQERLRGYYAGMPKTGMWPTPEPTARERIQRIRELENDPFVAGSYKRKLLDEMTQRPAASSAANTAQIIPTLIAELNKLQQKPIEVHSDHNLRVVVEDNRAVQVHMESASDYASRTHDSRTLTPYQAVKMRQLEK
jgi:TP901 family phage tail tape measure protein